MTKQTLRDIEIGGKRVLMRVDYNVPVDEQSGEITDDARIRETLPTLQDLLERGAAIVLMAHFGRPKGQVVPSMSLRPVAQHLGKLIGRDVQFADDCVGQQADAASAKLNPGEILMLENLRFH